MERLVMAAASVGIAARPRKKASTSSNAKPATPRLSFRDRIKQFFKNHPVFTRHRRQREKTSRNGSVPPKPRKETRIPEWKGRRRKGIEVCIVVVLCKLYESFCRKKEGEEKLGEVLKMDYLTLYSLIV